MINTSIDEKILAICSFTLASAHNSIFFIKKRCSESLQHQRKNFREIHGFNVIMATKLFFYTSHGS